MERYRVAYEYKYIEGNNGCTYKRASGFKFKEKALAKFKDLQENPQKYLFSERCKLVSVKFMTIITEEVKF